ncbi:unnamed protein product, partial [Trichobilharzia regenti]
STLPTSDTTDIYLNEDKVGGSSKKDKGNKSKGEMKSAEVKKTKTKEVNDVTAGVTVVAQVHAVEDVNESNEDFAHHDCDNNNNNDAKDDGKSSGKLRSPKRLIKSGKKAKTPKDESEASLKKSEKMSKKKEKSTNGNSEVILSS